MFIQPYNFISDDYDDPIYGNQFMIRIWCHDEKSNKVLVKIKDYKPFLIYELPVETPDFKWVNTNNDDMIYITPMYYTDNLITLMSNLNMIKLNDSYSFTVMKKKKLYYYNEKRYIFLKVEFNTLEDMRKFDRQQNANEKFRYVNDDFDIILKKSESQFSIVQHLIANKNLSYSGWHVIKNYTLTDEYEKISYCNIELEVSCNDIEYQPDLKFVTSPVIGAIDIETYTPNPKVMPNNMAHTDCIFMISLIISQHDKNEDYVFILGDTANIEEYPDTIIVKCEDETELITELFNVIVSKDVTILTGYNILGYDFDYIAKRQAVFCMDLPSISLIKNDQSDKFYTSSWNSSAYGDVKNTTIIGEGRICLDMIDVIKRAFKLDSYKLDYVARYLIKDHKVADVTYELMFQYYKAYLDFDGDENSREYKEILYNLSKVAYYNVKDSILCINLIKKLNQWIALIEQSSIFNVNMQDIYTRGQQIRMRNRVHRTCVEKGIIVDVKDHNIKSNFKGATVLDPIPGLYKNVMIFDFSSLYPSLIIAYNVCFSTYVDDKTIPDAHCNVIEWEEDLKDDEVYDSDDEDDSINEDDEDMKVSKCTSMYTIKNNKKYYKIRFIKKEYRLGILPIVCSSYIKDRSATRKQIGPHNEDIVNTVLDQRQNALKISNNSVYGVLGVRSANAMSLPQAAAVVTALGRKHSKEAADYVRNKYNGKIVYGDTDSIMVDLDIKDPSICEEFGNKLANEISDTLMEPLKLEYENTLAIGFFIKKKKYSGVNMTTYKNLQLESIETIKYDENNIVYKFKDAKSDKYNYVLVDKDVVYTLDSKIISGLGVLEDLTPNKGKMLNKGIITARRDNCTWQRNIYNKIMLDILFGKKIEEIANYMYSNIMDLLNDKVSLEDLTITRSVKTNYKDGSTHPLKLFSQELKKRQYVFENGERLSYVFVNCLNPEMNTKQGYKMRILEHYKDNKDLEPLDYKFYITSLLKPVDQIVEIAYPQRFEEYKAFINSLYN